MDPSARVRDLYTPMLEAAISASGLDRSNIEMCRRRIRQLLGRDAHHPGRALAQLDEGVVMGLASWPTSPAFGDRERALLTYAERLALDPSGATDEEVGPVRDALGEGGLVAVTVALGLLEALERLPVPDATASATVQGI